MNKNTIKAVEKRLNEGKTAFFIGDWYYTADECNGIVRRREQQPGRTPVSDWECIGMIDGEGVVHYA